MGYSNWSDKTYTTRKTVLASRGYKSSFVHDEDIRSGRASASLHDDLNIKGKDRESRDSDDHPNSNAIAVGFDVTGSMGRIPKVLQTKLCNLMSTLLMKDYIEHPQILFGGIGDATCDSAPIQVGQFESGNEMDEGLGHMWLEGGGGGQKTESYELFMHYVANHVHMDCLEKRDEKGYLFMIGDEMPYSHAKRMEVQRHIGDNLQDDVPIKHVIDQLREKFHVFFIVPTDASWGRDAEVRNKWVELLGSEVLFLDNADLVCELIVSTIGLHRGVVDVDGVRRNLDNTDSEVNSVVTALSTVTRNTELSNASVTGELVGR